jgi:hypothetical protein
MTWLKIFVQKCFTQVVNDIFACFVFQAQLPASVLHWWSSAPKAPRTATRAVSRVALVAPM